MHDNVARVVDSWLRGYPLVPEVRRLDDAGQLVMDEPSKPGASPDAEHKPSSSTSSPFAGDSPVPRIFLFGVGRDKLEQAANDSDVEVELVTDLRRADLILTTKSHYKRGSRVVSIAEESGTPVHVVRKNTAAQVQQFLRGRQRHNNDDDRTLNSALQEAHEAAQSILDGKEYVDLAHQRAYVRRLQHILAQKYNLSSLSVGVDPRRHVRLLRK